MYRTIIKTLLFLGTLITIFISAHYFLADEVGEDMLTTGETDTLEDVVALPTYNNVYILENEGFFKLYDQLAMPNTVSLAYLPEITGDLTADAYIFEVAQNRGYQPRRAIAEPSQLKPIGAGNLLQIPAAEDYWQMRLAAEAVGINLTIASGYRSIDEQRDIFVGRLLARGVSISRLASGSYQNQLNDLLSTTAPPGFSRHHSGYTLDLASADSYIFENSKGYEWLSANNFANARAYGFIPSYPEIDNAQGPEPEAWEFVWVGKDLLATLIPPQ